MCLCQLHCVSTLRADSTAMSLPVITHSGDGYGPVRSQSRLSQHEDTELQMVVVGAGRADLVAQSGAQEQRADPRGTQAGGFWRYESVFADWRLPRHATILAKDESR